MEYFYFIAGISLYTALSLGLIWFLDRFEKEPIWVLALVFLWGALPAGIISLIFETAVDGAVAYLFGLHPSASYNFIVVIVAPVFEEIMKAVAILTVLVFMRRGFHGVLDGIVYGAVIGLGFGSVETGEKICYVLDSYGSSEYAFDLFVLRVGFFGFMHATWTACTGLGVGIATVIRSRWLGALAVLAGLFAAMTTHGFHNTLCVAGESQGDPGSYANWMLLTWLVHCLVLLAFLTIIIVAWFVEWRWIRRELRNEVLLGNVGERDFKQVSKWFGRLGWELRFLAEFDFAGFFRIRKMFNLLVKLAFARRAYGRHPGEGTRRSLDEARRRVAKMRTAFV